MVELIMVLSWKSLLDFLVLFLIYIFFLYPRWKKLAKSQFILKSLLYLYISILLFLTLMPILTSLPNISFKNYSGMHLIPFDDVINSKGPAELQIFLNVIMLIPFGFLLPMVKKHNLLSTTLITCLLSLSIEIIQPLLNTYRISDVTDVITNTIGGVIGYLLYLIFKPYLNKYIFKKEASHDIRN